MESTPLPPFAQGLHVLTDIHSGFSGLAAAALEGLADEYRARKIAVFACYPTTLDDGLVSCNALRSQHHAYMHLTCPHTQQQYEQLQFSCSLPPWQSSTVPVRWSG